MLSSLFLASEISAVDPWWLVFGRLHPLVLHFPIVLILLGALVALVRWIFRQGDRPSPTVQFCLWTGLIFAGFAVWTGWVLGDSKVDGGQTLLLHRWISIAVLVVMAVTAVFDVMRRSPRWPWAMPARLLSFCLAAILVAITGHLGAEMKWGTGYVLAPLAKARAVETPASTRGDDQSTGDTSTRDTAPTTASKPEPGSDSSKPAAPKGVSKSPTWTDVESLLSSRCGKCHGPEKQKGSLQLVPWAAMFAGDQKFWVVLPGDPDASLLLARVALPTTHDDRMPPEGEGNPLTQAQQTLLHDWIAKGAIGPDGAVPPAVEPPTATPTAPPGPTPTAEPQPSAAPPPAGSAARANPATTLPGLFDQAAEDAVIEQLRARGARVRPLHLGSPWLELDFARLEPPATNADCDGVGALGGNLWTCSVAGTAMTDAAMATLGVCLELRSLRLDNTAIGDAGIAKLESLQHLEVLNCFATKVSDASIDAIARLGGLKAVYLGSSAVTQQGLAKLREARPALAVHGNASAPKPATTTQEDAGAP